MHLKGLTVLQLGVILVCPCSSPEGLRRRAQALTWVENLTLLYRALLPVPVWYNYFEGSGMGMVLCAMTTGLPYLPLYSGPCCTLTSHFILQATACVICTSVKTICLLPICYCQHSTLQMHSHGQTYCSFMLSAVGMLSHAGFRCVFASEMRDVGGACDCADGICESHTTPRGGIWAVCQT